MGFFKNVGNKLKRAVSLKNLVRGVTGNFSAVGEDVSRIIRTEDPKKAKAQAPNVLTDSAFQLPKPVVDVLNTQDSIYKENLINSVASVGAVQDANSFMSKLYIQSMWLKYKNWIIGFVIVLSAFLLIRKFFFKKTTARRKR